MRPVPPRSAPQSAAPFNEPSTRHRFLSSFSRFPAFPVSQFSTLSRLNVFQCIFVASKLVFWETISKTFDKMSLFLCRNRRENVRRKCLTVITQNYSNGWHRQIATICVFYVKCKILSGKLEREGSLHCEKFIENVWKSKVQLQFVLGIIIRCLFMWEHIRLRLCLKFCERNIT